MVDHRFSKRGTSGEVENTGKHGSGGREIEWTDGADTFNMLTSFQ